MGKILDRLSVSLGQTQHEQIWHQWPNSVPKNDHLHCKGESTQNTQQKMIGPMQANFTAIADILNGEF